MDLNRDIYKKLIVWKNKNTHKVLELEGARQVGKTYILQKFAKCEYKKNIYINMIGTTGADFLKCLNAATEWEPGQKREERPIHKAFNLYDPEFEDQEDLIIIIDEIQGIV